jgi:3-hydroxyisobutyrate dehydrogenase-like beta-hydroxyacid dehydrogenase
VTVATLGFLGLGSMGTGMAARLLDGGHDLVVWNRTAAAADDLVTAGARLASTPAEALAAEVSFSMLANDEAAHAVLSNENLAAAAGRSHISMASLSPEAVSAIAERAERAGVGFAAAPVMGRPLVAAAGQLNILAAGDAHALSAAAEAFALMGKRVWPLGDDPTRATIVKIAVNYNIIHAIQAIGESMALVEANGVEPGDFAELLSNTLFGGIAYTGYSTEIATRGYRPPGFSMALGRKDLGLAEQVAAKAGFELPTSAVIRGLLDEALADPELSEDDWGALAEVTRRRVPRA